MKSYIYNFINRWWRLIDQQIVTCFLILIILNIILVATSGAAVASRIGLDENHFISKQMIHLLISVFLLFLFSCFSLKIIKIFSCLGFIITITFLVMVKFYGYEVKGAKRWINILNFSMQPSEFIKPIFAIVVALLLDIKSSNKDFPACSICLAIYFMISFLLITQPDIGMFMMISCIFAIQLFIAGLPLILIIFSSIIGIITISCAYYFIPHVNQRITSFLNQDKENISYQVSKSLAAFRQGGLYGKGPGEGTVKYTLPDSHTDFIFAVAGEELGAIICLLIILLFGFIVIKTLHNIKKEENMFILFAVSGIISQFALGAIINIGVTLNLLPTKGMTLPFISYGGSATLSVAITCGILLSLTKKKTDFIKNKFQNIEI